MITNLGYRRCLKLIDNYNMTTCVDPGEEIRKGVKSAKKKSKELKEKVSKTPEEEKEQQTEGDDVMICSATNMASIPTILTSIVPQDAEAPIDI